MFWSIAFALDSIIDKNYELEVSEEYIMSSEIVSMKLNSIEYRDDISDIATRNVKPSSDLTEYVVMSIEIKNNSDEVIIIEGWGFGFDTDSSNPDEGRRYFDTSSIPILKNKDLRNLNSGTTLKDGETVMGLLIVEKDKKNNIERVTFGTDAISFRYDTDKIVKQQMMLCAPKGGSYFKSTEVAQ